MNSTEISKYLSYILRHHPEAIGLTLDAEGWGNIEHLISGAARVGKTLTVEKIAAVVASNDKKRFALSPDGQSIRAVQGHSTTTVDRTFPEMTPPAILYHGTATRFIDSINAQGLIPKQRQYVHLSSNIDTATNVGQRYGKVVILQIDAQRMHAQGFKFFLAENGVWLVDSVPLGLFKEHSPAKNAS
jgi:putative RNA 2'-phosphotransferase